jgi:hypothetical protein
MLLLPKELEPGKAANTAQRSDVRLYAKQHLVKLRDDVVKLMNGTSGLSKDHYEAILIEMDKIVTKLNSITTI